MKIEVDHTSDPDNIILTLHGLNDQTCRIAVPKQYSDEDWVWGDSKMGEPFGLNLIDTQAGYHNQ